MRNFESIYATAIGLWPAQIEIRNRIFNANGTIRFSDLDEFHDAIERELDDSDDDLLRVMDWVIYKSLHSIAEYLSVLCVKDLDRGQLKKTFEEDLFETDELEPVRKDYLRSATS